MKVQELIPRHKDDQEVIEQLKKLTFEEIRPIVPDLLEWLQDINWPIAGPVSEVLLPFTDEIAPYIVDILKSHDGIWKLWILTCLLRNTKNPIFLKELERMVQFPTRNEIEEGVHIEAQDILNGEYD